MKLLASIIAVPALVGCATTITAEVDESQRTVPRCTTGADCTAKWEAAQVWIARHAGFKLQTVTDVLLQTSGPSYSMKDSRNLAVTVLREPDGPQRYRIVARISCGNPFGCMPDALPSLLDFNRTVSAAEVMQ